MRHLRGISSGRLVSKLVRFQDRHYVEYRHGSNIRKFSEGEVAGRLVDGLVCETGEPWSVGGHGCGLVGQPLVPAGDINIKHLGKGNKDG